jgi:hypothetical protein
MNSARTTAWRGGERWPQCTVERCALARKLPTDKCCELTLNKLLRLGPDT